MPNLWEVLRDVIMLVDFYSCALWAAREEWFAAFVCLAVAGWLLITRPEDVIWEVFNYDSMLRFSRLEKTGWYRSNWWVRSDNYSYRVVSRDEEMGEA